MSDINRQMNELAEYAIKSAKRKYNLDLDFTDQSVSKLETIIEKLYWQFSGKTERENERVLLQSTAGIWGSFLGEFMIRRWGGSWSLNGARHVIIIQGTEFSPSRYVFQKIIGETKETVGDYLFKVNLNLAESESPSRQNTSTPWDELVSSGNMAEAQEDKRMKRTMLEIVVAVSGIVIVIILFIVGFVVIKNNGELSLLGIDPPESPTSAILSTKTNTCSPSATMTMLPTFTPKPSVTPRPTRTATNTPTATSTLTQTASPTMTK